MILKRIYAKYPRFVKISSLVIVVSGVGWISLQIRKTYEILNNALDTSVVHFMEPRSDKMTNDSEDSALVKWLMHKKEETVFNKAWNSIKFSYARRLLSLTSSDNKAVRFRAVKQLAMLRNLDNWHYSLLAHMCDPRTAVALARTEGVDLRFFIEPPHKYIMYSHQMIVNTMKEFLTALHAHSHHVCMEYFISRAFVDAQDVGRIVDHDSVAVELTRFIQNADDILPTCLESILHHSAVEDFAKDIICLNGLPLLMEVHNRFKNNLDVSITLCRIIANVTVYREHLDEIFRTGWISVLAEWMQSNDFRISAPAARALANLDVDEDFEYLRRVYVLHPFTRTGDSVDADVVFVHGLLGGVFYTWRQRDKNEQILGLIESISIPPITCPSLSKSSDPVVRQYIQDVQEQKQMEWENVGSDFEIIYHDIPVYSNNPSEDLYSTSGNCQILQTMKDDMSCYSQCWPRDWLAKDCNNIRIIGVNYDTKLSMWAPMCPAEPTITTLEERSNEIMAKLVKAGLGKKPIIWVAHSMGGLIVKNILCKAWESNQQEVNDICLNTKGLVFCSTPHLGSSLANLNQATTLVLWPSVEVQELKEDSPKLHDIHNNFINLCERLPIKVISFVETKSTVIGAFKFNFLLVSPRSANPGVGEYFEIPLDHLGICKPAGRQSFIYQKIVNLVNQVIKENT